MPRSTILLLSAYLALGILYSLATPPFEASDEVHHYPVVQHIATGRGLPVQQAGVKTAWAQEGSQPPAYYLLSAALTFWIDTGDFDSVHVVNPFAKLGVPGTPQNANYTRSPAELLAAPFPPRGAFLAVYILRLVSLLMGAGTVAFTYLVSAALSPLPDGAKTKTTALLAASLVAFNPMFLFISASVNNDNLVWFEAALTLFICVHLVRGPTRFIHSEIGERWWHAPALGLLLGLTALTKLSGLVLFPVVGLALLLQAARTGRWRRFIAGGAVIGVAVAAVSAWWYIRNFALYGDLLGLDMMMNFLEARQTPLTLSTLLAESRSFWYSYWGLFGAFSILAPQWVYAFFSILCAAGVLGLLARLILHRPGGRLLITDYRLLSHFLLAFFILATAASLLRWNMTSFAMQGRLTFTTLAPIAMYLALGLSALIPARHSRVAGGVLAIVLGLIALLTASTRVAAAYLPPAPVTESQLPPGFRPVYAVLAPGVELVGYTVEDRRRYQPGDSLPVTLFWRALEPMDVDYNLFLHALARDRVLVGSVDSWPGGGLRPTSFWRPGEIYADRYDVEISSGEMGEAFDPSVIRLDVAMWKDDPNQPLPITSLEGRPIASVVFPAGLLEPPRRPDAAPETIVGAVLEGGISLAGFSLPAVIAAGQPATVTLHWEATELQQIDYTVFVHIVDSSGGIAAQADGPPLGGFWPTSAWQPGYPLADPHTFTVPSPGEYRIFVGLYDPATVIPLIAYRADGSEWPDRAIELTGIRVQ